MLLHLPQRPLRFPEGSLRFVICVQSMVEYCIINSCIWYIMIKFNREFKQRLTVFLVGTE